MSELSVTLIDVGWGDSILLAWTDGTDWRFGLIDSNDSANLQSSYVYLKRFFEKLGIDVRRKPLFDFVILSHAHADHGQGLKKLMREFGATYFWYPKSTVTGSLASLIRFASRSSNVQHHQSIDNTKLLPKLGDVQLDVLWPEYNRIEPNENNNSIVLSARHEDVVMLLTGDAEGEVWDEIGAKIPSETQVFKVPHHGSVNGTFLGTDTPWLDSCPHTAKLGISSHVVPFSHPDQEVVDEFKNRSMDFFRTDEHYHVTFTSDGSDVEVKYSHV